MPTYARIRHEHKDVSQNSVLKEIEKSAFDQNELGSQVNLIKIFRKPHQ